MAKRPDRITLVVPEDLIAQAKAKAALGRTNVSAVVRALLMAWIDGVVRLPLSKEVSQEEEPQQ